ncbi:Polycomb protein SCMH1 [Paragonimus heterotremus]|uniref:Polycomb protein SCMH1 n=1 Tax=Paragonimus heterotremus TaxID=100268 RepID=A0A8J4SPC2_9TREM|nr:Polycomb protein SCMH1 [Paragonimus heterotremus]
MSLYTSSDTSTSFEWDEYLTKTGGRPADSKCFKQSLVPPPNHFEVNTLLEAEDQRSAALDVQTISAYTIDGVRSRSSGLSGSSGNLTNSSRRPVLVTNPLSNVRRFRAAAFSLAQVVEVWGSRLRIRLVGTDDRNDCWFLVDSDQIRPYPSGESLQPPFGYMHNHLHWSRTLKTATEGAKFADPSWFISPPPDPADNCFQVGDKLEAVDRRNTQLICPASVGAVNGQHILVSFDGWSGAFDYWTRFDSRELFPVGWCKLADYPLQAPGPNALRSPTSHSTPGPVGLRAPVQHPHRPSLDLAVTTETPNRPKARLANRSRNRRLSRPVKRYVKSSAGKRASSLTAIKRRDATSVKTNSVSAVAATTSWPGVHEHEKLTNLDSSGDYNDSINSSARSLSSPPVIHPATEDVSHCFLNLSGSSPDHPPPSIEAALPLPTEHSRTRRTSSSSDCVVRLQAKSPSAPADYAKPEQKSWQVVTMITPISREKLRKTKTNKRHRHSIDKKAGGLRKKFKLVSDVTNRVAIVSTKRDSERLTKVDSNEQSSQKCNTVDYAIDLPKTELVEPMRLSTNPTYPAPHNRQNLPLSTQTPLHLLCGDYNSNIPGVPFAGKPGNYHHHHHNPESVSSVEPTDDEIAGGQPRTGVFGTFWYPPTKIDVSASKILDNYSTSQITDDYLDGQSLAPHVSSSTVSPSSLDLGPGPLPTPAYWTIDEVCHYLTTRDSSLTEVAQKFKHHEIDGQALLLLNMESLRNYLKIKLGPALKVDHLISRLKRGLL